MEGQFCSDFDITQRNIKKNDQTKSAASHRDNLQRL